MFKRLLSALLLSIKFFFEVIQRTLCEEDMAIDYTIEYDKPEYWRFIDKYRDGLDDDDLDEDDLEAIGE